MCCLCVQWVSETGRSYSRSTSLKVDANKFAPQGSNPNELRQKVKEVKYAAMCFIDFKRFSPQGSNPNEHEKVKEVKYAAMCFIDFTMFTTLSHPFML